jgi:hypothetical protein
MTEERKILEMLQTGQINIDEALGLLEALCDSSGKSTSAKETYLYSAALQQRLKARGDHQEKLQSPLSSKLLKIDIHQSGEEDTNLNFQIPVESALVMENLIPANIKKIITEQGFELGGLLVSLNPDFPKGRILDMHVSDDDYDTNIVLEVTS